MRRVRQALLVIALQVYKRATKKVHGAFLKVYRDIKKITISLFFLPNLTDIVNVQTTARLDLNGIRVVINDQIIARILAEGIIIFFATNAVITVSIFRTECSICAVLSFSANQCSYLSKFF